MESITWVRPSGREITTNDREVTTVYAKSQGWTLKSDSEVPPTMEMAEHAAIINAFTGEDAKNSVEAYVIGVNGVDIDKRGSLETVKEKALKALRDGNGS